MHAGPAKRHAWSSFSLLQPGSGFSCTDRNTFHFCLMRVNLITSGLCHRICSPHVRDEWDNETLLLYGLKNRHQTFEGSMICLNKTLPGRIPNGHTAGQYRFCTLKCRICCTGQLRIFALSANHRNILHAGPESAAVNCRHAAPLRPMRAAVNCKHIPHLRPIQAVFVNSETIHYRAEFRRSLNRANTGKENYMKKLLAMIAVLTMTTGLLAGCGRSVSSGTASSGTSSAKGSAAESTPAETKAESKAKTESSAESRPESTAEKADEENYDTGDASLDDPLNADEIGEKELLVVSFGTSYNDSRRLTIGAIEKKLAEEFPDYSVRRAFTSQIIIDHILSRDNIKIDNVKEALDRAVANNVKTLVVQPTHLMKDGLEYTDLVNEVADYADAFEHLEIADPLLAEDGDFEAVATAVTEATAQYDDGETAICFMGHGTEAESNMIYSKMQTLLTDRGFANYYVGTVEASPSLEDLLALVKQGGYKKVVLEPLMVVAGDHANNDMAGDEDGSWKKEFENAGYEVECILQGLGENEAIRSIYVDHARAAIERASA